MQKKQVGCIVQFFQNLQKVLEESGENVYFFVSEYAKEGKENFCTAHLYTGYLQPTIVKKIASGF